MPVTATSTATVNNPNIIYNDDIRGFLRDVAGRIPGTGSENILFSELPQFSDAEIARAEKFTVSRFNVMTPVTTWVPQNIPLWLMLLGVTDFLLLSETFRQARNQLTYGDGDVQPIGIDDKAQLYQTIEQTVKAEFEEKAKAFKIYNNLNSCYGALGPATGTCPGSRTPANGVHRAPTLKRLPRRCSVGACQVRHSGS